MSVVECFEFWSDEVVTWRG